MKAAAEEKVITAAAVSDERKEEIRDEWGDLQEQERQAMEAVAEATHSVEAAQEELTRIQEEKRLLMQELLDGGAVTPETLELTPKMTDETIAALKAEFDKGADGARKAGYIVQEGIDFAAVEMKLRAETFPFPSRAAPCEGYLSVLSPLHYS